MYVQNLVKMLLSYRGTFEIKGKFKDLPSVLRHEIMSHYRTKFTIMFDGLDSRRNYYQELNDEMYINIGSIHLKENNEDCDIFVQSQMLIVLGKFCSKDDIIPNDEIFPIGKRILEVLTQNQVQLYDKIRATEIPKPSSVSSWEYKFVIPVKDLRYHFTVTGDPREFLKKKEINGKVFFERGIFRLVLRKITLIHENMHDITQDEEST